jgi:hypothetical protein
MPQPYYRFDGSNDVVSTADGTNLNSDEYLSAIVWAKNDSSALSAEHTLCARYNGTTDRRVWSFSIDSDEKLYSRFGNTAIQIIYVTSDSALSDIDKWHCYAFTFSKGTVVFYVDGVVIAKTVSGTAITSLEDVTTQMLDIGGRVTDNVGYWGGEISGVKIYNTALTSPEVKQLYSGASVPFKYKGANQTNMITSWTNNNFDTLTTSGTDISSLIGDAGDSCYSTVNLVKGKRYRLTLTTSVYITGIANVYLTSTDSTTGGQPRHNIITHTGQTWPGAGETDSWEFTAGGDYDNIVIIQNNGTDVNLGAITGMSLVSIGAVAEYDGSGIASDKWFDKSGNDLHGTVTNATVENASSISSREHTYTDLFDQNDGSSDLVVASVSSSTPWRFSTSTLFDSYDYGFRAYQAANAIKSAYSSFYSTIAEAQQAFFDSWESSDGISIRYTSGSGNGTVVIKKSGSPSFSYNDYYWDIDGYFTVVSNDTGVTITNWNQLKSWMTYEQLLYGLAAGTQVALTFDNGIHNQYPSDLQSIFGSTLSQYTIYPKNESSTRAAIDDGVLLDVDSSGNCLVNVTDGTFSTSDLAVDTEWRFQRMSEKVYELCKADAPSEL